MITVARVGVMVTYKIGTGLVVARRDDGSWSPPSAISSFGLGWGAQVKLLFFFNAFLDILKQCLVCFSHRLLAGRRRVHRLYYRSENS